MTNNTEQLTLINENEKTISNPVVSLGITFENEVTRREYFREELRRKLPELKKIEGFPIGLDEDIIALSDPPYYTACPNPWINDFIEEWEKEKYEKYGKYRSEGYHREPFAADVSEGKSDPVYNAHTYHTKVPYKAIMHYILHYTNPGDIIYDGFSGTGMTGLAGYMCGSKKVVESLGYKVSEDGRIINNENEIYIGERKSILSDLSPVASYIASNYNSPNDSFEFKKNANKILSKVKEKYDWMYVTNHLINDECQNGEKIQGTINYFVWSDVFVCPHCSNEIVFWKTAVDKDTGKVRDIFSCQNCGAELKKKGLEKALVTNFDRITESSNTSAKIVPVLINYTVGKKRYEKEPDENDLNIIKKINELEVDYWVPNERMCEGKESRRNDKIGVTHVHQFYTKRNLIIFSSLYKEAKEFNSKSIMFWLNSLEHGISRRVKHGNWSFPMSVLSGTLYIPSLSRENNPFYFYENKLEKQYKIFKEIENTKNVVTTNSSTNQLIRENSIDYIFVDPPFGSNLMYSELNYIWESWLKVKTNIEDEAIVNSTTGKNINSYKNLLESCFNEFFKVLKPGRWLTVEFSNSQASVWNAIQEAIQKSGFVVANVSTLDKQLGSFKAVTSTTAVKQDLVISAYKPTKESIQKMREQTNTNDSAWTFVNQHLEKLTVFLGSKGEASLIPERTPRILFDRMIAYHVQNGLPIPISSAEFQVGVSQRFPMRDGMAFLESQVAEYDKKRTSVKEFSQMSLFVSDENSAIEWIRQQLIRKPQTRQDLHPQFMKEIQHIAKHEQLPELDHLLAQNFLRYEGDSAVPDQIISYLHRNYKDMRGLLKESDELKDKAMNRWYVPDPNKQADLEKLRERTLLREFDNYVDELGTHKKKLRQFRTEAVRAGFKKAWSEKDYGKIVIVAERLPETVIQEDDKLLMYYDNAQVRLGL